MNIPLNKSKKTTESYQAELKEINPSLKVISEYKSDSKIITIKCLEDNYEWDITPTDLKRKGYKCPKCEENKADKEREEYINELHQINPNIDLIGEFKGRTAKTIFICNTHNHEWEASPRYLLQRGKCPKCTGSNKKTIEEFKEELKEINPDIEVLEKEYLTRDTPILVKCLKCNREWDAIPYQLLKGSGCINCKRKGNTNKKKIKGE